MSLAVDLQVSRAGFDVEAAFEVGDGQVTALLGPNGAGKSTLLDAIAGLVEASAGTIAVDGETIFDPDRGVDRAPEARELGVVFQDRLLFPHLTAQQNAAFPLRARRPRPSRADVDRLSLAALEQVGASEFRNAKPATLSGGQAQRVALARALAGKPRVLLLDEPLSALDLRAREEVREVLRSVLGGFTGSSVVVTHDPVEAMTLADRLVVIEDGHVSQSGTPAEIRDAPKTAYAADLVGLNLFRGRLERADAGAGRIVTAGGGEIFSSWPKGGAAGDAVAAMVSPVDVTLHLTRPEGSARNVFEGTVASIAIDGNRVRVRLASRPELVAEITRGSLDRMPIARSSHVWASFKAVEVRIAPS